MAAVASQGGKARSSLGWKLVPEIAPLTQGLVVSPFSQLDAAEALFIELDTPDGSWLRVLSLVLDISDANDERGERDAAAAIAFTWSGLQRMGLAAEALEPFSEPFREGMHQADRQRRLGDLPGAAT